MFGLVVLRVEARNSNQKAEGLHNFFFVYGRNQETRDFYYNLGSKFTEVPDEFRDRLDVTNFKHFVRKPTTKEIRRMLDLGYLQTQCGLCITKDIKATEEWYNG